MTTKLGFLAVILFSFQFVGAQETKIEIQKSEDEKNYYQYDNDFLPASFHKAKRDSLRKLLPEKGVAVFFSSPERNRSNDVYYEYHQDPNFYYLTGLREANSMVIIYKDEQELNGLKTNEILFMQNRNPSSELWNGRRLGVEKATKSLEFETVMINEDFAEFNPNLDSLNVIYQKPYALEDKDSSKTDNINGLYYQFLKKSNKDSKGMEKLVDRLMAQLRQIKTPEEIELLKRAIEITCEAQNELMRNINMEMAEYQTEAIIEYVFKKNGAEYTGFPSIQGSGENSCILHYNSNRRPLINGGLLVSDVGAEYRAYTADVTRTIPPNGKFTKEQAQIYNLVLVAQDAGIEAAQAGASFWASHLVAQEVIAKGLVELKIIKKETDVRKYFMHGTSHYLGLDVHDAGLYGPLEVNNVITVEPGIYIAEDSDCDPKWWNIGVRIEDDIWITEGTNQPFGIFTKNDY